LIFDIHAMKVLPAMECGWQFLGFFFFQDLFYPS